jgi:hypothetical protein
MKKKHPRARMQRRMTKPRIGIAIMSARLSGPDEPELEMRFAVEEGRSDSEKIRLGEIGNSSSVGVSKWQLYRRDSRTACASM